MAIKIANPFLLLILLSFLILSHSSIASSTADVPNDDNSWSSWIGKGVWAVSAAHGDHLQRVVARDRLYRKIADRTFRIDTEILWALRLCKEVPEDLRGLQFGIRGGLDDKKCDELIARIEDNLLGQAANVCRELPKPIRESLFSDEECEKIVALTDELATITQHRAGLGEVPSFVENKLSRKKTDDKSRTY